MPWILQTDDVGVEVEVKSSEIAVEDCLVAGGNLGNLVIEWVKTELNARKVGALVQCQVCVT